MFFLFLESCVREVSRTRLRQECIYMPLKACTFLLSFYFSVCMLCTSCRVFVAFGRQLFPRRSVREASRTEGQKKAIDLAGQTFVQLVFHRITFLKLSFRKGRCLWEFEIQKEQHWQYRTFKSIKIMIYFGEQNL